MQVKVWRHCPCLLGNHLTDQQDFWRICTCLQTQLTPSCPYSVTLSRSSTSRHLHHPYYDFTDPPLQDIRSRVHRMAQDALRPGGMFILEAYTPRQIAFGSGGPKTEDLLLTESQLKSDFDRMEFVTLQEIERDVVEGDEISNTVIQLHECIYIYIY
jgi:hypothetical protein